MTTTECAHPGMKQNHIIQGRQLSYQRHQDKHRYRPLHNIMSHIQRYIHHINRSQIHGNCRAVAVHEETGRKILAKDIQLAEIRLALVGIVLRAVNR